MGYSRNKYTRTPGNYQKKPPVAPVEFVAPTFTPSTYQSAILEAIRTTTHNILVDAVAGSGKTSTLALIVAALLEMRRTYVVVAFNKPIATELQNRGMNGRTFHSIGYGAVMSALQTRNNGVRPEMDAQKVSTIVGDFYPHSDGYAGALIRLVGLAKNHIMLPNVSDDAIISLISHFDIEWEDESISDADMCRMVRDVLTRNNDNTRVIDFDDQLYFVELFGLNLPKFDFVLVDESQDTNPLRRALVGRMMHATSRIVAVGDERQAIYGFTGASHDSMDLIADTFNCVRLPLSVSYRCPVSVVELAQTIVPHILPREGAPDGTVSTLATFKRSEFRSTDLVLCRNNAPLVRTAYKLLAARIPCKIMGREIGRSLTTLIKRLTRKSETLESLMDRLWAHRASETERAMRERKESKAQAVQDKVDAIVSILESFTPEDTDGGIPRLIQVIENMFSDQPNGCVTLASVHKAKGLEAPRVFVLDRQLMPSKMARQDWQQVQERNLMYVAYTRSLDTLYFVESEKLGE